MLGKGDFVGIVGIGVVAVDGLGLVGVLGGRDDLGVMGRLGQGNLGRLLTLLGGAGAKVGGSGASHGVAERVAVFEAVELGRGVHLGRLDRVGSFGAAGAAVGSHGLAVHVGRGLLGEGKGIEESTRRGGGRGAKVKDPDNVKHGEQDETGAGGLASANVGVDEGVDAGAGEHQAGSEVAAEGDVVGLDRVGGDDDKDANIDEEGEDDGPPGELGEALALNLAYDAGDEAYEPGKHADGESGEGKRVTDDVAHLEAAAAIGPRMFHFLD